MERERKTKVLLLKIGYTSLVCLWGPEQQDQDLSLTLELSFCNPLPTLGRFTQP